MDVDETLLRTLTPTVIGILVRRGAHFAAAEDAVQDALVEAVRVWPDDPLPRVDRFPDRTQAVDLQQHRGRFEHSLNAIGGDHLDAHAHDLEVGWETPQRCGSRSR